MYSISRTLNENRYLSYRENVLVTNTLQNPTLKIMNNVDFQSYFAVAAALAGAPGRSPPAEHAQQNSQETLRPGTPTRGPATSSSSPRWGANEVSFSTCLKAEIVRVNKSPYRTAKSFYFPVSKNGKKRQKDLQGQRCLRRMLKEAKENYLEPGRTIREQPETTVNAIIHAIITALPHGRLNYSDVRKKLAKMLIRRGSLTKHSSLADERAKSDARRAKKQERDNTRRLGALLDSSFRSIVDDDEADITDLRPATRKSTTRKRKAQSDSDSADKFRVVYASDGEPVAHTGDTTQEMPNHNSDPELSLDLSSGDDDGHAMKTRTSSTEYASSSGSASSSSIASSVDSPYPFKATDRAGKHRRIIPWRVDPTPARAPVVLPPPPLPSPARAPVVLPPPPLPSSRASVSKAPVLKASRVKRASPMKSDAKASRARSKVLKDITNVVTSSSSNQPVDEIPELMFSAGDVLGIHAHWCPELGVSRG